VWSGYPCGGDIVKAVLHRGGRGLGIGLNSGHDLELEAMKVHVRQNLDHQWRPKILLLCPMCTGSGPWSRFNVARGANCALANRAKQAANAKYTALLIEDQCKRGGRVIFEHPWGTELLYEKVMQDVTGRWD
jgi:hypothetical protein